MTQKSYIKNLGIPETTIGFEINNVFAKHNLVYIPDPKEFETSCNMTLLQELDTCEITRGKISFIPLEFLETFIGKTTIINPLERKQHLLNILGDKGLPFLKANKYKGVPLVMFRRPYLDSSLTKTVDHCRIIDKEENLINRLIPLKIINPDVDISRNTNEWMSNNNLIPLIQSYTYLLRKEDVSYRGVLVIMIKEYLNRPFFYSELKNIFNLTTPTSERFILFHILYRSHFTSVVVDMKTTTKDGRKTKIAYFFNSCGYNPNHFELNKNFWFIDSSLSLSKHENVFKSYQSNGRVQAPIEALTDILLKEWGVTNFVFNTFTIQNLDSECGIFSSFFLICCLLMMKKKKKEITVATFKHVYFNMWSFGSDHMYSCLRGLFFVTNEDVGKHVYENSLDVFPIKNEKFKTYKKIIEKVK